MKPRSADLEQKCKEPNVIEIFKCLFSQVAGSKIGTDMSRRYSGIPGHSGEEGFVDDTHFEFCPQKPHQALIVKNQASIMTILKYFQNILHNKVLLKEKGLYQSLMTWWTSSYPTPTLLAF
jgi:hypothetical protein